MNYYDLLQNLKPEILTITVNNRLAILLQEQYFELHADTNSVRAAPQISPLEPWLQQLWRYNPAGIILSPLQQQLAWQQIWYRLNEGECDVPSAQLSYQGYVLQQQWMLDETALASSAAAIEQQRFNQACLEFDQYCDKHHYYTIYGAMRHLARDCKNLATALPDSIYWVGFDELNPLQQHFFDALKPYCSIKRVFPAEPKSIPQAYCASVANVQSEIKAMCAWAKQQSARGKLVGCIVPDLAINYAPINSEFTDILVPENLWQSQIKHTAFNISTGSALAQVPLVRCAINIIKCATLGLSVYDLSQLLNSPYLYHNLDDLAQLAKIDAALHQAECPSVRLDKLISLIQAQTHPHFKSQNQWLQFLQHIDASIKSQGPAAWVNYFKLLLKQLYWCNHRSLNSDEHQAIYQFFNALDEIAKCELLQLNWNATTAYQQLYAYLNQCVFKPEGHDSLIQILGTLEATTLQFDAAWVMSMSDQQWPILGDANPFISIALQQEKGMPHCSTEKDIRYAERQMGHLKQIADEIIFSYPEELNSCQAHPTQAIASLPIKSIKTHEKQFSFAAMDCISDNQAPPLCDFEQQLGGSQLFQHFNQCQFRAFAKIRLKASRYPSLVHGIQAKGRGILIHRSLELIWQQLGSQKKLLSLTDLELYQLIEQQLDQAIAVLSDRAPYPAHHPIMRLERQRLIGIIQQWLDYEKKRKAFEVIACEDKWQIQVNNLQLNIKIDRVDRRDDGSIIIIDYKSGKAEYEKWLKTPLQDPQLPLYQLYTYEQKANIAFAHISGKEVKLGGISQDKEDTDLSPLAKVAKKNQAQHWDELQQNWQRHLEQVAYRFAQGEAIAQPNNSNSCQYCDLHSLCRIKQWQKQQI